MPRQHHAQAIDRQIQRLPVPQIRKMLAQTFAPLIYLFQTHDCPLLPSGTTVSLSFPPHLFPSPISVGESSTHVEQFTRPDSQVYTDEWQGYKHVERPHN